jgi:hypothetical protein
VPTGDSASKPFTLKEARLFSLVSSNDQVVDVPLSTKALGQHSIAIGFARPGTLTSFEQTSTAGLATATAGMAAALSSARDEFQSGLKAVQTSQATIDAIQAEARTNQIKRLQDQKTMIEAQSPFRGLPPIRIWSRRSSKSTPRSHCLHHSRRWRRLNSRLLPAPKVATLRAEIQRLQAQFDLLKIQMELEKLKKPPQGQ